MNKSVLKQVAQRGIELLDREDPALSKLLAQEYHRQNNVLAMVAASSVAHLSVLACEGMATSNVTTEGYPGARFHAGCKFADEIELLAVERAKLAFRAQYANVQPHSGTSANLAILFSLLSPGETILGMELKSGGHLTHGASASASGRYFKAIGYGLTPDGFIDYEQVGELARRHKPKIIICGASSYPRTIDFKRFREIADDVGAYLLADISHIAGLVVSGHHPSPIDHAHFTTTSTYKQLYGPRGGIILMGKDHNNLAPGAKRTLSGVIQNAIFPFFQGTPNLSAIAAKARALAIVITPEFKMLADRIVANARDLAGRFTQKGYRVISGGTDNHIVLIDTAANGITGVIAERALEASDIIVNRNVIRGDEKSVLVTSGIRLGTNSLAVRGMAKSEMSQCADLVDRVISSIEPVGDRDYTLRGAVKESVKFHVAGLCKSFPLPQYPSIGQDEDISACLVKAMPQVTLENKL